MAIIDTTVLNEIQYHLLETPNSGASWASGHWTAAEVAEYFNERQKRFLAETVAVMTRTTLVTTPNTHRFDLPTGWIATQRVSWHGSDSTFKSLERSSGWEADHGIPDWEYNTAATPKLYMDDETPQLHIQIAPASFNNGVLDLLYVGVSTLLSNTGESFSVPDEFVPTIKWGVMADMLAKVGRPQDTERADYCEQRFQDGVEAVKLMLDGY